MPSNGLSEPVKRMGRPAFNAGQMDEGMRGGRASRILSGKMNEASSAGIPAGTGHQLEKGKREIIAH